MASVGAGAAAPGIRLSQMSAGGLGDVGNSVNLFRGDVNFPMQLVSVQGRNNLDVAVTAFYSSNVHQQVSTWNMTAPTDVLGAGWSLPFEKIVVEGQNTGSNIDDEFYLVTGGAPRRLVRTGADSILMRNEQGQLVMTTRLGYEFYNVAPYPQNKDDHFRKRYLVSIHQEDRTGNGLPAILFDYHVAADSAHPGSLKSVTYPQGAVATYTYAAHTLLNSAARQTVQSPGPGYAPRVWYGARYVAVTWHSAAESRLVT